MSKSPSGSSEKKSAGPPPDFRRFLIDEVHPAGENLTIRYGGRVFGGIVRCLLPGSEVERAIRPGVEVFVRYHTSETGQPGQVAQMIIRHPTEPGWAEIFSDVH
jgi:hypothetical protein